MRDIRQTDFYMQTNTHTHRLIIGGRGVPQLQNQGSYTLIQWNIPFSLKRLHYNFWNSTILIGLIEPPRLDQGIEEFSSSFSVFFTKSLYSIFFFPLSQLHTLLEVDGTTKTSTSFLRYWVSHAHRRYFRPLLGVDRRTFLYPQS